MKTEFGLDMRMSKAGRFGRGTYFASTSQYSDNVSTFSFGFVSCRKLDIDAFFAEWHFVVFDSSILVFGFSPPTFMLLATRGS